MDKPINNKIRTISKICGIISTIMLVLMIISTSALTIAGIALCVVPQDYITASFTPEADLSLEGKMIENYKKDFSDNLSIFLREGKRTFSIGSSNYLVDNIESNDSSVTVHAVGGKTTITARKIGISLLVSSLTTGSLIYVFIMLKSLMKAINTEASPFTENVVKKMTSFAISLIPYAVIKSSVESSVREFLMEGNVRISFNPDFPVVFFALILILLIMIFKHGVVIQKESDETL